MSICDTWQCAMECQNGSHISIVWSNRCRFCISHHVFARDWGENYVYFIWDSRDNLSLFIVFVSDLLLSQTRSCVRNTTNYFAIADLILRSRTTLPLSFECSLYATNRYCASYFVYIFLLVFFYFFNDTNCLQGWQGLWKTHAYL